MVLLLQRREEGRKKNMREVKCCSLYLLFLGSACLLSVELIDIIREIINQIYGSFI